jgi:hypothetical protein
MVVVRLDQGVRRRTLSAQAENGVAQRRGPQCVVQRRRREWVAGDGLHRSRSRVEPGPELEGWRSGSPRVGKRAYPHALGIASRGAGSKH